MTTANFANLLATGRKAWITFVWSALVMLAVGTADARAGTYVIDNCPSAPVPNGNSGPWTVFGGPQNNQGNCTGPTGSFIGPLGGEMHANTSLG